MMTLDLIRKPVAGELEAYEAFVTRHFRAESDLLAQMLRHALSTRGKGIRPTIVLLSAAMNAAEPQRGLGQRAYLAAMLVEMVHVASLIHDDVIDEADTRRGRPSLNALWQSRNAVIAGDYILARNMGIGMRSGQFDLVAHVCDAIAVLCEGEVIQNDHAARAEMTRGAYFGIIRKKTASLMGVSASAGAMAVYAPQERVERMQQFGQAVGMAFQIQDDILDYMRTAHTGKPTNNDLREGKITLPLLCVLERADDALRAELLAALGRCGTDSAAMDALQQAVVQGDGLREASEVMRQYLTQAASMLAEWGPSPYRDALANLCAYIAERDL